MTTTANSGTTEVAEDFAGFFSRVEPSLRRALVARFGRDRGRDATVGALAHAWEHWERVRMMANPAGYVYRVGCRSAVRVRISPRGMPQASDSGSSDYFEPALPAALGRLSKKQRAAVLLVHGWGYPLTEAAQLLDMSVSTLRTHLDRGLTHLRRELEVEDDSAS